MIAERVYSYHLKEHERDDCYTATLENQIKDVDGKLNNIMRAIEAGKFNETMQSRMNELQEQRKLLSDELCAENNRKKYALKPEHVVKYLECFIGNLDEPSIRDKVLSYLVDKILVYKDKIAVTFYYSDDKRKVNLADLNETLDNQDALVQMVHGYHDPSRKYEDQIETMFQSFFSDDEGDSSFS